MSGSCGRISAHQLGATPVVVLSDRQGVQDKRLSLEYCRRLLPAGYALSDTEMETFRDQIYAIAEVAVDEFVGISKREGLATDAKRLTSECTPSSAVVPVY